MKVVTPIAIGDAIITSTTALEPAAGEVAWNSATSYTVGTVVYRPNHRQYKNTIAGVDATLPESAPTRWLDVGATNKYAMFDLLSNTPTQVPSPLTIIITPGVRVGALGLVGVEADTVTVSVTSSGVTVYSATQSMRLRNTTRWSEYFFGAFGYKSKFGKFNLPMYSNAVITISLTKTIGTVKCAGVVLGTQTELGGVQYNAESNIIDYSLTTRDAYGNVTLVPRKTVPTTMQTVWMASGDVGKAIALRAALRATPALWSGLSDSSQDYFESLFVLGFFRKFTIQLTQPKVSLCTLEIEGL